MPSTSAQKIRFGLFELDLQSGELFKLGHKLNLRGQPVEVLSILLERAGEVVTREELCKRLWPEDTFVDFEHSLNTAVKKLRQALDDDVETPRYIETLPKKGYRFVGQVESAANRAGAAAEAGRAEPDAQPDSTQQAGNLPGLKPLANSDARAARLKSCPDTKPPQLGQPMVRTGKAQRWRYVVAVALILGAAAGALYWLVRPRVPVVTGIHQLTHTGQQKGTRYNSPVVTDGTRLYFRESNHGKVRIAQMSTKGGDISALEMPAIPDPWVGDISVDGSDLLVAETKLEGVDGWVWIASLPNGPQRRVDELLVNAAAFVPGSNQLLYAEAAQPKQVFRADLDGNHARRAFSVPEDVHDMIVSPDRKLVRFEVAGGRMWECGLDGSGMRRFFAEHGRPLHVGKWNADGRTYAFVSEDAETRNLWAAAEPGRLHRTGASKLVQLTNGPISFSVPTFSRDGKQMFANGEIRRGELAIYEPASHEFIPYLDGMSAGFFDYSSDGQWVAYVTYPQNVLWRSR
ncbi:MAG TPA: winged helix-turn-helix domain-containing protein, partial [Candidatus Bathyarchaeia archaeon]|nr:winged helix-turn-helix domain-containing protein [Candidatus Bathyarchaeia archaeon]